jgi:hypothetical protein
MQINFNTRDIITSAVEAEGGDISSLDSNTQRVIEVVVTTIDTRLGEVVARAETLGYQRQAKEILVESALATEVVPAPEPVAEEPPAEDEPNPVLAALAAIQAQIDTLAARIG